MTVTRLPVANRRRAVLRPEPLAVIRGAVSDLRATANEHMPDPDGLREIAQRIERALAEMESP